MVTVRFINMILFYISVWLQPSDSPYTCHKLYSIKFEPQKSEVSKNGLEFSEQILVCFQHSFVLNKFLPVSSTLLF